MNQRNATLRMGAIIWISACGLLSAHAVAQVNLTGTWAGDDGGVYYLRQLGNTLWWAGLSTESARGEDDFQKGLLFSNVYRGTIAGNVITGEWADVPRGSILQNGTLTLNVVSVGTDVTPGGIELHKQSATGGFGGSRWSRVNLLPFGPQDCNTVRASSPDILCKFGRVMRNDNYPMGSVDADGRDGGHLKIYKDNVVVLADVIVPPDLGYGTVFTPFVDSSYFGFMCTPWWQSDEDPPDGDIGFQMHILRDRLEEQPSFWTEGWLNPPSDIRDKLDYNQSNHMHPELVMYARPAGRSNCNGNVPALLPGWKETNANSVLVNGRPVNGQVDIGNHVGLGSNFEIRSILGQAISPGTLPGSRVRVTGVLSIDCHGFFDPCSDDDPEEQNVEIHPVYSIDIIQNPFVPRPNATLTGAWNASDVGTYYLRQLGDTVWWLGLSRDRGLTFANVFRGTINGNGIIGEWADVPLGTIQGSGTLNLTGFQGPTSTVLGRSSATGGFGASSWEKMYDR